MTPDILSPELREDLRIAAEEIARLRAFMRAVQERASDIEGDPLVRLSAIVHLSRDAFNLSAPVPGRVARLWVEEVGDACCTCSPDSNPNDHERSCPLWRLPLRSEVEAVPS